MSKDKRKQPDSASNQDKNSPKRVKPENGGAETSLFSPPLSTKFDSLEKALGSNKANTPFRKEGAEAFLILSLVSRRALESEQIKQALDLRDKCIGPKRDQDAQISKQEAFKSAVGSVLSLYSAQKLEELKAQLLNEFIEEGYEISGFVKKMTKGDSKKEKLSIFTKEGAITPYYQSPSFLQHKLSIIKSQKEITDTQSKQYKQIPLTPAALEESLKTSSLTVNGSSKEIIAICAKSSAQSLNNRGPREKAINFARRNVDQFSNHLFELDDNLLQKFLIEDLESEYTDIILRDESFRSPASQLLFSPLNCESVHIFLATAAAIQKASAASLGLTKGKHFLPLKQNIFGITVVDEITFHATESKVSHVKGGGSYADIVSRLEGIKQRANVSDAQIAQALFDTLHNRPVTFKDSIPPEHKNTLVNTAYLLFTTEVSRSNAALPAVGMLLDLIKNGLASLQDIKTLPMSAEKAVDSSRCIESLMKPLVTGHTSYDSKISGWCFDDRVVKSMLKSTYDLLTRWLSMKGFQDAQDAIRNQATQVAKMLSKNVEKWFNLTLRPMSGEDELSGSIVAEEVGCNPEEHNERRSLLKELSSAAHDLEENSPPKNCFERIWNKLFPSSTKLTSSHSAPDDFAPLTPSPYGAQDLCGETSGSKFTE